MKTVINNLRLFWQGAILSYIALFSWLRPITYLASKIVMPLAQILFFTFMGTYASGKGSASFYVIGNAIQITAASGIFGVTLSVGGERWSGTLPYLFGTPANRLLLFLGRSFMHIIDGFIGVLIGLMWGAVLLGVDYSHANGWALMLAILITTFSTAGLGLWMGCISLITSNVMLVNNTVYFLLLIFSGANVPLATMPTWMQSVAMVLPLTRGIAAARAIIAGAPFKEVGGLLWGEFLIGVIYVCLGYALFRTFETIARRRGSLETV